MSLRDGLKKMSKSDPSDYSRIMLSDNEEEIVKKKLEKQKQTLCLCLIISRMLKTDQKQ